MAFRNDTVVSEFILLGLSNDPKTQVILFFIFMIGYMIILTGNILLIILIVAEINLHTPMYFFLSNLSFLDLCYSTSIIPRILKDLLSVEKVISYAECVTQMYIAVSLAATECILLAIMAYDRYVAICSPLHYTIIMSKMVCVRLTACAWLMGFLLPITNVGLTISVHLCSKNEMNNFLCEITFLLSLSCENIVFIEFLNFLVGVILLLIPSTFIVASYIKIIYCILKIASLAGWRKAFSTCGSHMIVVTIFYGSIMAVYMKPRSSSSTENDKVITVFYSFITPMLNPVIYSLRNHDVNVAFLKFRNRFVWEYVRKVRKG